MFCFSINPSGLPRTPSRFILLICHMESAQSLAVLLLRALNLGHILPCEEWLAGGIIGNIGAIGVWDFSRSLRRFFQVPTFLWKQFHVLLFQGFLESQTEKAQSVPLEVLEFWLSENHLIFSSSLQKNCVGCVCVCVCNTCLYILQVIFKWSWGNWNM